MSFSRRLIGSLFVVVIIAGALGAAWWRINSAGSSDGDSPEVDDGNRPEVSATGTFATNVAIPVSGSEAVRDTLVISVSAAAQAAAEREAPL